MSCTPSGKSQAIQNYLLAQLAAMPSLDPQLGLISKIQFNPQNYKYDCETQTVEYIGPEAEAETQEQYLKRISRENFRNKLVKLHEGDPFWVVEFDVFLHYVFFGDNYHSLTDDEKLQIWLKRKQICIEITTRLANDTLSAVQRTFSFWLYVFDGWKYEYMDEMYVKWWNFANIPPILTGIFVTYGTFTKMLKEIERVKKQNAEIKDEDVKKEEDNPTMKTEDNPKYRKDIPVYVQNTNYKLYKIIPFIALIILLFSRTKKKKSAKR